MNAKANSQRWLILTSVVWCGALVLFTLYHPGTGTAPDIAVQSSLSGSSSIPPTDRSGSETITDITFESLGEGAKAKVFWQVPEPGRVKLVIELPPEREDMQEPTDGAGSS